MERRIVLVVKGMSNNTPGRPTKPEAAPLAVVARR
jgi:hypothetical protein